MRLLRTFCLVAATTVLASAPAAARSIPGNLAAVQERRAYLFNIPAQPLPSALEAFGIVTGHQVIYDSRLAASRRSNAVVGVLEPEAALRILLAGTDLTIRYTGPKDVAILPASGSRLRRRGYEVEPGRAGGLAETQPALQVGTLYVEIPPASPRIDAEARLGYMAYGRTLRSEIRRALDADETTARRSYNVQFDVWIDGQGRIGRAQRLRSSGKPLLDRDISRVLRRLVVSRRPPVAMPQPVRVTILSL